MLYSSFVHGPICLQYNGSRVSKIYDYIECSYDPNIKSIKSRRTHSSHNADLSQEQQEPDNVVLDNCP